MKLEAGKFYFDREGKKIGPIVDDIKNPIFPFRGGTMGGPVKSYRADGSWNADGTESRFDLVEEWTPPAPDWEDEDIPDGVDPKTAPALINGRQTTADKINAFVGVDIAKGPDTMAITKVKVINAAPGYEPLAAILREAHDQAATGKGNERHANGKAFLDQPIMAIGRMCGMGFQTGQIQKKVQEATSMAARGEGDAAIRELLGAINYAAAAVLLIRENRPK